MPYLGDFLGQLLAEITNARMHADLESVRIAELYASHPLLKHMPVPHVRLPNVTLDVTVAIREVEEAKKPGSEKTDLATMRRSFDHVVNAQLKQAGIRLADKHAKALRQALDQKASALELPPKVPLSITHVANEMVASALAALRQQLNGGTKIEPERIEKVAKSLKAAVHVEFSKFLPEPARIKVLATTSELREAGPGENLPRFRLSITEEAIEWAVIEADGEEQDRLIPE